MEKICNGNFIAKDHTGISYKETNAVLDSIKKNVPVSSVSEIYAEETDWAGGTATLFSIPLKFNDFIGRDRYNNRIKFNTIAPKIEIVVSDETGVVSENDPTEQHQLSAFVIFCGCKVCAYRCRNWSEYTNSFHYGYKFKIEDLLTYDILPCLRAFAEDFKQIIDPINSDIITI